MKRRMAALFLAALAVFAVLAGCSRQQAQQPVQEPDTEGRTLTHSIGEHQKVVYSFHLKRLPDSKAHLYATLLAKEVDEDRQAGNWCGVEIGGTDALEAFRAHHVSGLSRQQRWMTSGNRGHWTMEQPYASMKEVEEADVEITYFRNGKELRVSLAIDGQQAWEAGAPVKHLKEETTYLYLFSDHYSLSNIVYQDLGYTWQPPYILKGLLLIAAILAGIAAVCLLHCYAKRGEKKLYEMDDSLPGLLLSTGLFFSTGGLVLLLWGRGHPELLSKLFFGYLSLPLPAGGPGFWIPAAICAVAMLLLGGFILVHAIGAGRVLRLPCALGLGFCHGLWYYTLANIVLQSMDTIMALILFAVFVLAVGVIADNSVVKTYHVYNKNGYVGTIHTLEDKEQQDQAKK